MADNGLKSEKREFVRAVLSAPARIRVIDPDKAAKLRAVKTLIESSRSTPPTADQASWSESFIPHLADLLADLDEKLDRVIALLGGENPAATHLKVEETLDISGSGMRVRLCGSVAAGDLLHIALQLPGFSLGGFQTCGQVVRVTPRRSGDEGLFEVGIKFIDLSDEERERLISYAFDLQRRAIRQSRGISSADDA